MARKGQGERQRSRLFVWRDLLKQLAAERVKFSAMPISTPGVSSIEDALREHADMDLEGSKKFGEPNSIGAAFAFFGLDPKHPASRELLLKVLADVCFNKKGRPKGTKHWNASRYLKLYYEFESIKRDHPTITDAKAAALIKSKFEYTHIHVSAIRQKLPKARREGEIHATLLASAIRGGVRLVPA